MVINCTMKVVRLLLCSLLNINFFNACKTELAPETLQFLHRSRFASLVVPVFVITEDILHQVYMSAVLLVLSILSTRCLSVSPSAGACSDHADGAVEREVQIQ